MLVQEWKLTDEWIDSHLEESKHHKYFLNREFNDALYFNHCEILKIENLGKFRNLKALYLESNGIDCF